MSDPLSIVAYVSCARLVFEEYGAMFSYARFPQGACGPASEILGRCIEERFSVRPDFVEGAGRPERRDVSHAWLAFDGVIVDVTHDQYETSGLEPRRWVFVQPSRWHETFCRVNRRPIMDKNELLISGFHELYRLTIAC